MFPNLWQKTMYYTHGVWNLNNLMIRNLITSFEWILSFLINTCGSSGYTIVTILFIEKQNGSRKGRIDPIVLSPLFCFFPKQPWRNQHSLFLSLQSGHVKNGRFNPHFTERKWRKRLYWTSPAKEFQSRRISVPNQRYLLPV